MIRIHMIPFLSQFRFFFRWNGDRDQRQRLRWSVFKPHFYWSFLTPWRTCSRWWYDVFILKSFLFCFPNTHWYHRYLLLPKRRKSIRIWKRELYSLIGKWELHLLGVFFPCERMNFRFVIFGQRGWPLDRSHEQVSYPIPQVNSFIHLHAAIDGSGLPLTPALDVPPVNIVKK